MNQPLTGSLDDVSGERDLQYVSWRREEGINGGFCSTIDPMAARRLFHLFVLLWIFNYQ